MDPYAVGDLQIHAFTLDGKPERMLDRLAFNIHAQGLVTSLEKMPEQLVSEFQSSPALP